MPAAIPSSMPAAVCQGDGSIAVEELPVPGPGPGEVLIEVSYCGICGTDLHMVLDGWAPRGTVPGHEYSGVVAAVGPGVTGWAAGDRAVGGPSRGCNACEWCRRGRTNLCRRRARAGVDPFAGAFAGYKVLPARSLYRLPDGLDLRLAALTEPVAVAWRGVERAGAVGPRPILVSGGGAIGLLTVAVLVAEGHPDVTVSEPNPDRRAMAERMGAKRTLHPEELTIPPLPMELVDQPYAAAIECSGQAGAVESALANLDRAGMLVLSGTGVSRPRLDTMRILMNELVVTGTFEYTPEDYEAALDLLARGAIPSEVVEGEDQPLERLQWAMEQLRNGRLSGKVLVRPDA